MQCYWTALLPMVRMTRKLILLFFILLLGQSMVAQKIIARQGKVAFFSYTPVENIKAENNQVLSIIDMSTGGIAVSMLMNAFIFEKALMREHFNESYVESDMYPKATFEGQVVNFNGFTNARQTHIIEGDFSMHGVTRKISVKASMREQDDRWILLGSFEAVVDDYHIKIPPMLSGNIAKVVSVEFRFEYEPYEE